MRGECEDHADQETQRELTYDEQDELVESGRLGTLDPGDQTERQGDRHRIVAARLGFECAREPAPDLREAQRGEDGRCVRRRDDGSEQDGFEPGEVEESLGRDSGQDRGHHDSDGAQERRRDGDAAQSPPGCLQSSLEEDQDEADDADLPRELDVVELDPAGAVGAEKHSQRQEGHEHGNSRASRAERDEYARGQHRPDEEKRNAFVHVDILAARGRGCLEQDLGGGHGVAAAREELDGLVEIDLAHGDPLGEMHGVPGFEEDVQPPALDLRRLVLVPDGSLGRLGHARGFRVRHRHSLLRIELSCRR